MRPVDLERARRAAAHKTKERGHMKMRDGDEASGVFVQVLLTFDQGKALAAFAQRERLSVPQALARAVDLLPEVPDPRALCICGRRFANHATEPPHVLMHIAIPCDGFKRAPHVKWRRG